MSNVDELHNIPLKVLIVDNSSASIDALNDIIRQLNHVIRISTAASHSEALGHVDRQDINVIYIDPINLGIPETADFIFGLRRHRPHIVFVLYIDGSEAIKHDAELFEGARSRLRHYYRLDKTMPGIDFGRRVRDTLAACEADLRHSLKREEIESLRNELRTLESKTGTSAVPASVSLDLLHRLAEQLDLLEAKTKVSFDLATAAEFLGASSPAQVHDRVFMVMPYSKDWSAAVEEEVRHVCRELELELIVAKTMQGRFVPQDIWQGITSARIIVADLTDGNPNVAYEIGLADAIGRNVILLSQSSQVPFDFAGQRLVLYDNTVSGAQSLRKRLRAALECVATANPPAESKGPVESVALKHTKAT